MENNVENETVPEVVEEVEKVDFSGKERKHKHNRLFWPFILILVGIILLVQNLNLVSVHLNWWAAFIFIPVMGSLATAVSAFQKSGKLNMAVRSALGSALVVGTVATMFLFGMDWSRWWPLMLIAPGLSSVIGGIGDASAEKHRSLADWAGLNVWFGAAVILLGVGFLAKYLPIPALEGYLINRWWAIPILLAGVGAFVSAFLVCMRNEFKTNWTVWAFTGVGVAITATGLFAYFNLNWNLLSPIILIAAGVVVLSGILIKK